MDHSPARSVRKTAATCLIILALTLLPPRRSHGEDYSDFKMMYYQEDNNRIKVLAPTFLIQHEAGNGLTIKFDGIYNAISGATPTGAPVRSVVTTVSPPVTLSSPPSSGSTGSSGDSDGEEPETPGDDEERDDRALSRQRGHSTSGRPFAAVSGASPSSSPPPSSSPAPSSGGGSSPAPAETTPSTTTTAQDEVPMAKFDDERYGFNLGASKRIGRNTPGALLSFSQESDYTSTGLGLQDAVDFNKKNTTLLVGGAYTFDSIKPANGLPEKTKRTLDALLGVTQVLTPTTLLTANVGFGQVSGFLSDPYKVVELNGAIVPEKRPESKDKFIFYVGMNQFITPLNGAVDLGFRRYSDSFDVEADTATLAWYQKLGAHVIVSPLVRYYQQTAASFYDTSFSGNPEYYSSDYRASAFRAMGYGLRLIWNPNSTLSFDAGYERYEQEGTDGVTPDIVYPKANVFMVGMRIAY
jgi:hypothetical protein